MAAKGGIQELKITDDNTTKIVEKIKAGNFIITACQAVGISKELFYLQRRLTKQAHELMSADPPTPYAKLHAKFKRAIAFCAEVEKALAESEQADIDVINEGGSNWQARAWKLERRFKHWRRPAMGTAGGPDAIEQMIPPEDRGEDAGPQFGLVFPMALPEDVYVQMVDALRARGAMPGEHVPESPATGAKPAG